MRLELVRGHISAVTIEALEQLLEDARAGHYTGFVIALTRPRRRFSVHCVGEACESPTWSRGMCLSIDDELRSMIREDDRPTGF
ncbi:hypothetical protein [Caldimonas sp. KR1-144]|uniref:hypothetical protein n=1 Tax=Caldimonas sp. KR1-144 TaxID=3400911 RepID=UPI003C0CF0E7